MRHLRVILAFVVLASLAILPAVAEGEGKALYEKKCGLCHGKDGVAKKMAEPSANLNDPEWQKSTSVEAIVALTNEGKGKMKSFEGKLTPEEMKMIAEYILTLK